MISSPKNTSRDGIALVIVLGFLAILIVLAVAFLVSMRVERLATRNYVDVVKARNLTYVALSRCMDEVDQDLSGLGSICPAWGAVGSLGGSSADLLSGAATAVAGSYIPGSFQPAASNASASQATWNNIYDATGTNLVGRFAYVVVNCSGLLDANLIGGLTRGYGEDSHEIQINSALLADISNPANLISTRLNNWVRSETLPDLWICGKDSAFLTGPGSPDNLFTYSYFGTTQYMDAAANVANAVYIGGPESDFIGTPQATAKRQAIQAQFASMGAGDPAVLTLNLVDYLDSNYEPGNLDTFCTEPVPMINEIVITNTITVTVDTTNDVYQNRLDFTAELWYPFGGPAQANDYSLEVTFWTVGGDPQLGWLATTKRVYAGGAWTPGLYAVRNVFDVRTRGVLSGTTAPALPNVLLCEFKVRAGNDDPNGVIVDRVKQFGVPWVTSFNVPPLPTPGLPPGIKTIDKEADDPRLNWAWGDAIQWGPMNTAPASLGNQNTRVTFSSDPTADRSPFMYVRNKADLRQVGELGFLLYTNSPWHTIPLFDSPGGPQLLPVLDQFTAVSNSYSTGLVNPNSRLTGVVASVFFDTPVERYPGEGGGVRVLALDASQLASSIISTNIVPFKGVSEIGHALGFDNMMAAASLDRLQVKSIIRNSAELFSVRQNLFTVCIAAQAVNDENGQTGVQSEDIRAEQRAVVVVWRDPYPDSAGRHPSFVRYFKWLTE